MQLEEALRVMRKQFLLNRLTIMKIFEKIKFENCFIILISVYSKIFHTSSNDRDFSQA